MNAQMLLKMLGISEVGLVTKKQADQKLTQVQAARQRLEGFRAPSEPFAKAEPVIILGQLPGTFVYARNLMLIRREHRDVLAEVTEEEVK